MYVFVMEYMSYVLNVRFHVIVFFSLDGVNKQT